MAVIDASGYKVFKGISGTTYDAQLAVIVPQAIDDFQTYTGRTLATATFTEKHDGNNQTSITLFNTPLAWITSVTLTTPAGTSVTANLQSLAYDVNSGVLKFSPPGGYVGNGALFISGGDIVNQYASVWTQNPVFPAGHQNITVVYVAGYADGSYPAGMQGALYQYVDVLLSQALLTPAQLAFKSESLGKYKYDLGNGAMNGYADGMSAQERLFLRFKRMGGGQ